MGVSACPSLLRRLRRMLWLETVASCKAVCEEGFRVPLLLLLLLVLSDAEDDSFRRTPYKHELLTVMLLPPRCFMKPRSLGAGNNELKVPNRSAWLTPLIPLDDQSLDPCRDDIGRDCSLACEASLGSFSAAAETHVGVGAAVVGGVHAVEKLSDDGKLDPVEAAWFKGRTIKPSHSTIHTITVSSSPLEMRSHTRGAGAPVRPSSSSNAWKQSLVMAPWCDGWWLSKSPREDLLS